MVKNLKRIEKAWLPISQFSGHSWFLNRKSIYNPGSTVKFRKALKCRSEEHTSELQSRRDLVCRLLLEKKKKKNKEQKQTQEKRLEVEIRLVTRAPLKP